MGNRWPRKATPVRLIHWVFIGSAGAVLLIMSCTRFTPASIAKVFCFWFLAATLAFVFFRKRKIVLAIISLSWVLVNAGLTAAWHPGF